jgi:hypothetical protein
MYRILTENKNADQVKRTLCGLGLDFTVYYGEGAWHGQRENSLMIELDNITEQLAEKAAILIKQMNRQEAVLLQEIPVISKLL